MLMKQQGQGVAGCPGFFFDSLTARYQTHHAVQIG